MQAVKSRKSSKDKFVRRDIVVRPGDRIVISGIFFEIPKKRKSFFENYLTLLPCKADEDDGSRPYNEETVQAVKNAAAGKNLVYCSSKEDMYKKLGIL